MNADGLTCNGFFTVVAEKEPWKTNGKEPCADSFGKLDPFLRLLSAQMSEMDETLVIFTTYRPNAETARSCSLYDYPNLELRYFDAVALMREYDFGDVVDFLSKYSLTEYTRTSDVLRLLLARKYSMTYIDPDVHFVSYDKNKFFKEFVGAAVWNEVQCSLEMTNCAFCLSQKPLDSLLEFLKHRILFGDTSYLYAELGPAMFQKVLMNNYAIMLYSQNHPESDVVDDTVAGIKKYNHSMLHITSTIRLFLVTNNRPNNGDMITFLTSIRAAAGLKPLSLPLSRRNAEDQIAQYEAFVRNNYFDSKGFDAAVQFGDVLRSVLSNYLDVFNGRVTADNSWVASLSSAHSKENIYLECIALYEYIITVSDKRSQDYENARNNLQYVRQTYYGMLDPTILADTRILPIGTTTVDAILQSKLKKKQVEHRISARG